ncbi:MAG: efflux RND transporter permease subunit [Betaproteobacteria bacterium]|nr:efflux RND transporter permease subunit [Betaproteobacteria bacterium]
MKNFNLSEWALKHQPLVLYMILVMGLMGVFAYGRLGQSEDPPFTFKFMTIRTIWPGASAAEVDQQVTERLERKLQEVPNVNFVRSYSRPGESLIFFAINDAAPASAVPETQYQVRKRVGDIRQTLPQGVLGPFFNDEFGDTFGNIFAITGEGYSYADKKLFADRVRREMLRIPDVAKVDIIGEQEEKIFIELSNIKLATLGLDGASIIAAMQAQNAVAPGGAFETATDKIFVRATGSFDSVDAIKNFTIRANNRVFKIGDIATVKRGFADPPFTKMRYLGKESLGLGVSMRQGGDIVQLGKNLDSTLHKLEETLPIGLELHRVNDQPRAVSASIREFVRSLAEAVIIVLAVTFFSLGVRTGLVVALSIPLVLSLTFFFMYLLDVGLHKISLGALILGLGLLVDDAIIAVEMMAIKMEQGWDRVRAASFAYTSTAFPMLTGTLVTVAGFLPIATARSGTGEYTRSIFQVTSLALIISWFAAVIFIPYLGYHFLPDYKNGKPVITPRTRRIAAWIGRIPLIGQRLAIRIAPPDATADQSDSATHDPSVHGEHDVYNSPFYQRFRATVAWCVTHRKTVIAVTALLFFASIFAFKFVQQQFFPSSTRVELLVDLKLPEGSSFQATEVQVKKLEKYLDGQKDLFDNYVSYVGTGSPRFYFPLDQQLPAASFAQFVVTTNSVKARNELRSRLIALFQKDFIEIRTRVLELQNGPPVGFPVQFRVSGEEIPVIRDVAAQVADAMRTNSGLANVQFDWDERSKVIKLEVDQDKARLLGVSSQELAAFLNTSLNGVQATFYRERDKLIEVLIRGPADERAKLHLLESLAVPTRTGKAVTLTQIAKVRYEFEDGVIWRRDRLPTITVRADIYQAGLQPATATAQVNALLEPIRAKLPSGYRIDVGGAVEESAKGQASINAGMPLFLGVVFTVLMIQLMSFQRVILVVLTAPLGLIGVAAALLVFNKPFGFVAMLGTIALFGMIMRNSVILIDQIERDIEAGHAPFTAIIDATVRRLRPIALTALAAILAMIPLIRSDFFGPMAVAIMGGLFVATLLTLLFLPALYAIWFRITPTTPAKIPAAL